MMMMDHHASSGPPVHGKGRRACDQCSFRKVKVSFMETPISSSLNALPQADIRIDSVMGSILARDVPKHNWPARPGGCARRGRQMEGMCDRT